MRRMQRARETLMTMCEYGAVPRIRQSMSPLVWRTRWAKYRDAAHCGIVRERTQRVDSTSHMSSRADGDRLRVVAGKRADGESESGLVTYIWANNPLSQEISPPDKRHHVNSTGELDTVTRAGLSDVTGRTCASRSPATTPRCEPVDFGFLLSDSIGGDRSFRSFS